MKDTNSLNRDTVNLKEEHQFSPEILNKDNQTGLCVCGLPQDNPLHGTMNSLNRDWEEFEKLLYTYFRCGECEVASEKQGKEVFCVNCQWDKEQLCDKFSQAILSAEENLLREIMEEMPKKKVQAIKHGLIEAKIDGFNDCHDQVNTLLESKLSTVKK